MHVFLIAAITLDGKIAEATEQVSTAWTSPEDKEWFQTRTKQAGVVVMGQSTFATVGRPLPKRLNIVYSRSQPSSEIPVAENPIVTNLVHTKLDPKQLIQELIDKNYSEVAICGGSSIYSLFMKAGLIDTLYLTVEPMIFGKGVDLFSEELQTKLQLQDVKKLADQTLLLTYQVPKI